MAAQVPEYYLSRNWDYPRDGPLQIGNVIASLKDAHRPLATVSPDAGSLITTTKNFTTLEEERARSGGVSLMTTFLGGLLPISADVGVDVEKTSVQACSHWWNLLTSNKVREKLHIRPS